MRRIPTKRKAAIIGGSLGGLFAANLLLRNGWEVDIFERVPEELAGRGAGIVTHPELFYVLQEAGVRVDKTIGVKVESRITLAQDGSVVSERPLPQILTAWSKMYHVLRSALPTQNYHSGTAVTDVIDGPDFAIVTMPDGSTQKFDMVVAADGFRSSIRKKILPEVQLQYAGYVAWRGLVDEMRLSAKTREALFEKFAFCLPPTEQIIGYPVAGLGNSTKAGERRYNFVWYRATSEDLDLPKLLTDATGKHWVSGIPPTLIRREVLDAMEVAAHALLAPQFAEVVTHASQPLFQPIFDLEVPKMAFGRIALLGDAAFVARPHSGMGVTKAAGDAMSLVTELSNQADTIAALSRYSESRTQFGVAIVQHARHLGAYMQAQFKNKTEREMAERYRTPEAVMRETAVPAQF
ncbi:FAD binding domain-containing protein [Paraburkholderia caballeronis]|uniref:2-polyprenyl-6-methoxyphenol hydroxylase n=1 Tax=Paraburkholderia caballeronis TaxID=416943 RepID=A0A1H7L405_9BURK|nr:2-polyprenyl-6-methoxyphenol hydroxylase-like FAD-dependent oxidoreductase [Paraburkholderia caballeronis]PXX03652.1 2-polyprenyl-6-methoxyphenol hydroxylase-like FAD-dependent oxidoreductase [Paraburkholderia caballeronis]RAK04396.1 2-polyprenyl-6-methoxyphenol hydroxylase-like FAD-dependent oxidoreductase [Paraburkholderia caballeronis]SED81909.1 2-polyprenyl-6-methoxyphenol hydroxylase [Paraburkholderia caballeronis]SEK93793.1 2-polyprenyl-6-methoxyphenol hydroxylase [Paraburkholderia cab